MSIPRRRAPGELEGNVLTVLWRAGRPLSPGQVRAELGADLAYTTVMTILSRLHAKGSVSRSRRRACLPLHASLRAGRAGSVADAFGARQRARSRGGPRPFRRHLELGRRTHPRQPVAAQPAAARPSAMHYSVYAGLGFAALFGLVGPLVSRRVSPRSPPGCSR